MIPYLAGGAVIASIFKYRENEKPDLVEMGTSGASGLKKYLMGSVTAGVIGKTKIPVLAIPVSYELEKTDAIMFATNQFEKNKEILDKIVALSKIFSAPIHVIVFKERGGNKNADFIYNEEQLNSYLKFLKETFPAAKFYFLPYSSK